MQNSITLNSSGRTLFLTALVLLISLGAQTVAFAQGRPGQPLGQAPSAEAGAPIDLTGYWQSVVTYDWEIRMVTPRPGDYNGVPLRPAAVQIMDAWDPAKDTAMGLQCKSYGAPIIMRVPGNLHITWQDDETLKLETDAGEQTRAFHFAKSNGAVEGPKTWQGYSAAEWQLQRVGGHGIVGSHFFNPGKPDWGNLRVATTNLRAGYLRKNGIPYSENARMLEYYDLLDDGNGQGLLVVTSAVTDPTYLFTPYISTEQFLKQSSGASWEPSPCSAMW